MKVSLSWAQYYSVADLKSLSTEELVKLATERLGGVEGYTDLSKHYDGIVVARIVSCVKHSNADKLNLCKVDDGGVVADVDRDENGYVQVVCGAPNAKEGLLVAWLPPSSIVPASYGEKELFVLEARDLRGELSNGMLASPAELGLSNDHSGILEIDEDVKPGTPFKQLYSLDDVIIDIENKMFTHRPDCFGQLGVARELAGIQHKKFESPAWYKNPTQISQQDQAKSLNLSVNVEAGDLCPRYMAIVLDNVEIKPSPIWLQSHLKRVGIKPINNVVDITNYMMMLTAQPLHAFDFDKVARDGKADIIVRRPKQDEKMTLLDGKQIEPHKDAVLICDEEKPIALGGVMGGGNSEIDQDTKRVILECATFDMYNIRKTSMIHGIFTDAVTRFNKGQPAAQLPSVLCKSVQMLEELAGASISSEVVDSNPQPSQNKFVEVSKQFINERLGKEFSSDEIKTLLENVEFTVSLSGENMTVLAPFWRTDIEIPEDIVEEVGRLYGFNNLPIDLPKRSIKPVAPEPMLELKQQIRETLARAGANEVLTYSFVHGNLLTKAGQNPEHSFALRNALSPDLQYYRQSLQPSLIDLIHSNIKGGSDEFALFELGKVHAKSQLDEDGLPVEFGRLGLTYASKTDDSTSGSAYFTARKYLDVTLGQFGLNKRVRLAKLTEYDFGEHELAKAMVAPFEPSRSAVIMIDEDFSGVVGEYTVSVQKAFKLPVRSAGFEVFLSSIIQKMDTSSAYVPLSKYPSTEQDITLKTPDSVDFAQLKICLDSELVQTDYQYSLTPVSIFQKEQETAKNITFRLTISHNDRTLAKSEVNELIEQLVDSAKQALKVEQV